MRYFVNLAFSSTFPGTLAAVMCSPVFPVESEVLVFAIIAR